jgi:hypothetical protein
MATIQRKISAPQLATIRWLSQILELKPLELSDLAWRFSGERVDRVEEVTTKEEKRAITSLLRRRDQLPAYHKHLTRGRPANDGNTSTGGEST